MCGERTSDDFAALRRKRKAVQRSYRQGAEQIPGKIFFHYLKGICRERILQLGTWRGQRPCLYSHSRQLSRMYPEIARAKSLGHKINSYGRSQTGESEYEG